MVANRLGCPVQGCNYETTGRGMGGHISGHKMRGDIPKDAKAKGVVLGKTEPVKPPVPPQEIVTPASVADSLLERVITAIRAGDFKDEQIKSAKLVITGLEQEVQKLKDEADRLLKIHNDQVKRKELTSSDELVRLAKQPKSR